MINELPISQLRKTINPSQIGIEDTDHSEELKTIIGQKKAVKSLKFGLQIDGCGYNVYVAGSPGTGKMTSVKSFLEEIAGKKDTPQDWCYVNNFDDPYNPHAVSLEPGKGAEFQKDMDNFTDYVKTELPKAFESDEYMNRKDKVLKSVMKEREEIFKKINKKAEEKGFTIQTTPMGASIIPTKEGQPMDEKEYSSLSADERDEIEGQRQELQDELKNASKEIRKIEKKEQDKVKDFDKKIIISSIGGIVDDLIEKYSDYEKIIDHLKAVQNDIVENVGAFKPNKEQPSPIPGMQQAKAQQETAKESMVKKYKVNLLIDNCNREGAPVIIEYNPTYNNLVGRIEKEMAMGALSTDFTMIKPGALVRANGGFLVLQIEDLLKNVASYDGLKRALKASEVQIEELSERLGFMTTKSLRPEPIPLNVKVILIGPAMYYQLLHMYDHDFAELFKVKADYDTEMKFNDENKSDFISFISTYCKKEKMRPFDKTGIAELIEEAVRMSGDQEKLSTKFGHMTDLIRESEFWAKADNSNKVKAKHVKKAIDERIDRSNLIHEKIIEMMERGSILIDTEGKSIGQINGLSVTTMGGYMFGRPNRITASVSAGREGVMDIEREIKLGGPIHSKGLLILGGFLSKKYSADYPLTLSAKIVFEQSYSGIDGDSASAAELFALVSALSSVPLRQDIAVTGSMNQKGEIQPIGGVNHKIEGFFEVCKAKGLTGKQGVMIPESNIKNLVLRKEVIEAVKSKKFHIWSMKTIDDGLELLTGENPGDMKKDGTFRKGTLNDKVYRRLEKFRESLRAIKD